MIQRAIEKIEEMVHGKTLEILGRQYTTRVVYPVKQPTPTCLEIETLTGFAGYLKSNIDTLGLSQLLIRVDNYGKVDLMSRLRDPWLDRNHFLTALLQMPTFDFGRFMSVEDFIIKLQAMFVQDENTAAILRIVGNLTDSVVRQFADDGVTQQATVKAGVSRVEDAKIPNPVEFAPFRTFLEIEQPKSKFVFRMKTGTRDGEMPTCALFEADGGAWKNEATRRIKDWLVANTTGVAIIA